MVQHLKERLLSRYLKDLRYSQTHRAYYHKLPDRTAFVRDGKTANEIETSRLDTLLDESGGQAEQ